MGETLEEPPPTLSTQGPKSLMNNSLQFLPLAKGG